MGARARPGVSAAVDALRQLVQQYTRERMNALPPVSELAPQLGVSHATAWKAVRVLCEEGVLRARPGSGTRIVKSFTPDVVPAVSAALEPDPLGGRWENVRERIVADYLVRGGAQRDMLPGGKELVGRYGASYQTVRRAIASLVDDGRLVARGRRHVIVYAPAGGVSRTVVMVCPAQADNTVAFRYPNEKENLRWLEKECSGRGIVLRVLTVAQNHRTVGPAVPGRVPCTMAEFRAMSPLGYLVWLPGSAASAVSDVLTLLPPEADPVALAAPNAQIRAFATTRFSRRVRLFSCADYGRAAGETVGQYLLSLGHRCVLACAPANGDRTLDLRMSGLARVVQAGGAVFHLCPYELPARAPRGRPRPRVDLGVAGELVRQVRKHVPPSDSLQRVLDGVVEARGEVRRQMELAMLAESVRRAYAAVPLSLEPTVVVCWNDDCASVLLPVLRTARVRVPEDMSVVAFDDTADASLADVTSYNFNESKVLLSMLDWVLWPSVQRGRSVVPPPAGFITQRGTTRVLRGGRRSLAVS